MFRYEGGKTDWMARGLPIEGEASTIPRAADVVERDVPTCSVLDTMGEVLEWVEAADEKGYVVVDPGGVVLGVLEGRVWVSDPDALAGEVMRLGPVTFRPDTPLEELVIHLRHNRLDHTLVTDVDGRLMGLLRREPAERRLMEAAETQHQHDSNWRAHAGLPGRSG